MYPLDRRIVAQRIYAIVKRLRKTSYLINVHFVEVQGNDKPLRSLLWCSSIEGNSKQGAFVDRDVNAAMNILMCVIEDQRPEILDRSNQNDICVYLVQKKNDLSNVLYYLYNSNLNNL